MRNAPEYFVAAAYEVTAHVMKPSCTPTHAIAPAANEVIRRQYRRVYFHVIEQRHFSISCSRAIQPRAAPWAMRHPGADAEKQQKCQQNGYVGGNRAERVARNGLLRLDGTARLPIIDVPGAFISKAQTLKQQIPALAIRN